MNTSDPFVTEVAIRDLLRQFTNIALAFELSPGETEIARKALATSKGIHRLGNRWVPRFFLGGKQRAFGFHEHYISAMRIADLLTYRYHTRRVRKSKIPLSDESFNITLARAKLDAEKESEIISLLCHLDALLPAPVLRAPRTTGKTVSKEVELLRFEIISLTERLIAIETLLEKRFPEIPADATVSPA